MWDTSILSSMSWSMTSSFKNEAIVKAKARELAKANRISSVADLKDAGLPDRELAKRMVLAFNGAGGLVLRDTTVGNFSKINTGTQYWCRESCMSRAEGFICSDKRDELVYMTVYSVKRVGKKVIEYLNKIEEEYNFKGTHSSLVYEKNIPKKYLRIGDGPKWDVPECGVFCLRIADEWYKSPTLQQMCSLFMRLIVMQEHGEIPPNSFKLSRWGEGGDLTSPFDVEVMGDSSYNSEDYPRIHFPAIAKYGHMLLTERDALFSGSIRSEWKPASGKTEYGMQVLHSIFSRSGPTSFARAIKYFSDSHPSPRDFKYATKQASYFKFTQKYKVIEKALVRHGMSMIKRA